MHALPAVMHALPAVMPGYASLVTGAALYVTGCLRGNCSDYMYGCFTAGVVKHISSQLLL